MTNTQTTKRIIGWLAGMALLAGLLWLVLPQSTAGAVTEAELRAETERLEREIAANEEILHELEHEVDTLSARIQHFDLEIATLQKKIDLLNVKINQLTVEIAETEAELARQQDILNQSVRELYKRGNVTIIELLATSDSYTDFINQQEYLNRLKTAIEESSVRVKALKAELEAEKIEQEQILAEQKDQRQVLQQKRAEQAELLAQTQGEQARYDRIVSDLESQRKAAEKALQDFIASQNFVSLGYVQAGAYIGKVGSSGYSTGPHIHFAVLNGNNFVDPVASWGTLSYGMQWPVPNSSWNDISQPFGCVAPPGYYLQSCNGGLNSFHSGLDIAGWYGDPIVAARAGDIIFRGWMNGYGNTVIIDHGDGIYTYYPHMLE